MSLLQAQPQIKAEDPLSADQFARIMSTMLDDIKDVSFVFEGRTRVVPRGMTVEQLLSGDHAAVPHQNYQGQYFWRADGATRLDRFDDDTFEHGPGEVHQIAVLLGRKLTRISLFPQTDNPQPTLETGVPGSLNEPGSPERLLYLWYFVGVEKRIRAGYRFIGWEDVDGHRCAVVSFDRSEQPGAGPTAAYGERFWIDLSRGGHPLQVEYFDPRGIRMRIRGVQLARIVMPSKPIWIPFKGYCEVFTTLAEKYPTTPAGLESYFIVDGTFRLNEGLPNEVFHIEWKGDTWPEPPSLTKRRDSFAKPPPRRDPRGIRAELEQSLEAAQAKGTEIVAPLPERKAVHFATTIQLALISIGCGVIAFGLWMRSRRR